MTSYSGRSDEDVMEDFNAGDNLAFDELDRRHRERLTRQAFFRLPASMPPQSRRAEAEAASQAALIKAQATRDRPESRWRREKGRVRPWLDRILANEVADRGRVLHRPRHEQTATDLERADTDDERKGILDAAPARDAAPDCVVQRDEARGALRECLAQLGEPLYSTVINRYWEQMTLAEVAEAMGCSTATVFRRLADAERLLGDCLRDKQVDGVE